MARLAGDQFGNRGAIIFCLVRKHRPMDAVADGPDAIGGLEVIGFDEAALVELDADGFQAVAFWPRRKSRPCFLKIRWASLATSLSAPGMIRSRYSTTVPSEPSRDQTEPSSSPMTPAPIRISFFGTSFSAMAP